ncbi:reticulocyte binding protein 1a [Plasmodium gonderi]|uniref:Reticulocyte binding protein 1a n=1 Tax=Plasmodium gonderi TaxID=77519 RepID=A0A1Y1JH60_PLAGO|nr:reticulocyte binding protein 1a [Plasmodium gonderi]GAW80092.1 reticulocyte binding protein 1a [Plasmodium gonderi]
MKNVIYLVELLYLLNFLGSSHGENAQGNTQKKKPEKLCFFALNSNLKENKKVKYNREKKKSLEILNFFNEKCYVKKTNNANEEDVDAEHSSHNPSFISLNDNANGKSLSYQVYIKESAPHNSMRNNGKKGKENEKNHNAVKHTMQYQSKEGKSLENITSSMDDLKGKLENDNEYNPVLYMEVDYTELQYFKNVIDFIPRNTPYYILYEKELSNHITEYSDKLLKLIKSCMSEKEKLIVVEHEIEYAKKSTEKETLSQKERERDVIYKEYNKHIDLYKKDIKPKVAEMKNKALTKLNDSYCKDDCANYADKYNTLRKNFIIETKDYIYETYIYISKVINDFSVLNNILFLSNEVNIDIHEKIKKLELLADEMDELSHLYSINTALINGAVSNLESIKESKSSEIDIKNFAENYKLLSNKYCVFKYIKGFNNPIKYTYEEKIIKFNELFSSVIEIFEKKADELFDKTFDDKACSEIKEDSGQIREYSVKLCEKNKKLLDEIKDDEDKRVTVKIRELQDIINDMEIKKNDIVNNSDFIFDRHKSIYETTRKTFDEKLFNIKTLPNDALKATFYLEQIKNIKNEEKNIEERLKSVKNFYESIKTAKSKLDELNIRFENILKEISQSKELESTRRKNIEEFKEILDKMVKKVHYLKEVLSLKRKLNVHLTDMNELLNTVSYNNMEELNAKKDKINNDVNALYNFVHTENLNDIIKTTEIFINEKKEISLQPLDAQEVERRLKEIKETFAKLDFVSDDKLTDVYNQMSKELDNSEKIKKEIIEKQTENVNKKMSELYDSFTRGFNTLQKSMEQYNQEEASIKTYKENITKREEEYFSNENIFESNEAKSNEELNKHKLNFSKQKDEISGSISNIKKIINQIESQLNYYDVIQKYFNINSNQNEVQKVKSMKEKIMNENMKNKIDQYESNFNDKTNAMESIITNIQTLKKKIDSFKLLNSSINSCNECAIDIVHLRSKIKMLREQVQKEISETGSDIIVGENTTTLLLKNLNTQMINVEEKLNDNKLNDLENKKTDLLKFYSESKSQIHLSTDEKVLPDSLNRIDEWKEIRKEINELNITYESLNKSNVTLFKNNSITYIESIHNSINNIAHKITSNKNDILKSIKEIEDKINTIENNEDYKKVKNLENEKNIGVIKNSISSIKEIVSKYISEMTQLMSTSNSLENSVKKKDNDIEYLNNTKSQMRDIYEKIKKISEELNEKTEKVLEETRGKVNHTELEYEKSVIANIAEHIAEEKNKAQKIIEEMNSVKTKIEAIINKTSDKTQNELIITNIKKHIENAKQHEDLIKKIEQKSIQLREKANGVTVFDVKSITQEIKLNIQNAIKGNVDINKELNEIKGIRELLISTSYNSILEYLKKNSDESIRFNRLINEEFTKVENHEKNAKKVLEEADVLKEQITKDLYYSAIDDKVRGIEEKVREIIKIKENAYKFLEDSEKYLKMCSSHLENTKEGKKKIEYLKNSTGKENTKISENQMKEADDYSNKTENALKESHEQVDKAKGIYQSLLEHVTRIENVLNESLIKELKVKCEKKNDEAQQIFIQIKTVDGKIKENFGESEKKVNELKEKTKIEKREFQQLNDLSLNSSLEIDNCRQQLDNILSNIEGVKKNTLHSFDISDKSMKSVLSISELNAEKSLDKLKEVKENYDKNLEIVQNEINQMHNEEGKMAEISKKINDIENDLLKHKKAYEEGLLQKIKENADSRKRKFDLIRNEINSLVDPTTSIFIKLKIEEYDMTNALNNTGITMNGIHGEFTKSYNLIETYLSEITDFSVTFDKAKTLREKAETEDKNLRKKEEEAIELLNHIKKTESLNLLNEMIKKLKYEDENMTKDHETATQHIEDIKTIINELKTLNDINRGSSILNEAVNIAKKIKDSKHEDYKRKAKNMHEQMITLTNHFLSDEIKMTSGIEFNMKINFNYKAEFESDIISIVKDSNEILRKIEQASNDIMKKQRESENLVMNATDIYKSIKLKNEFNERFRETKNNEMVVSQKIRSTLSRLNKIEEIKCHYESFDKLLDNTEEFQKLKKNVAIYQDKKSNLPKESLLQNLEKEMNRYISSIKELKEKVVLTKESKEDISKLEIFNSEIENISKEINVIDSKIMEMNPIIDELYQFGKHCQSHWISLISYTMNNKAVKKLMMINKQKKNTEHCLDYIKKNSQYTEHYVSELKEFHGNKLTFTETSKNVENADNCATNFAKHTKDALKLINDLKNELYNFSPNSDINVVEESVKNVITLYDKLKEEKFEIDDLYRNMVDTKLKEIERNGDVFNPVLELHKSMANAKKKYLMEREKQLNDLYSKLQDNEADLIKNYLKYTPESVESVNKVYAAIESEMKILEVDDLENTDDYKNVEEYKKQISFLISRTDVLMNDIEMLRKENNYNLMDVDTETILKVTNYIETITNKLKGSKMEYEKVLEIIKENEVILPTINLKKVNINKLFENIQEKKKNILNDLYEQERLLKIQEKLQQIKQNVTQTMNNYEIAEKTEMVSKSFEEKKGKIQEYNSIYKIEREISEIKRDIKQTKDDVLILNGVLGDINLKREEMNSFFKQMSQYSNSNVYKSAKEHIHEADEIIGQLEGKIHGMNKLINDCEGILTELNNRKNDIEKEKNARTLRVNESYREQEEAERVHQQEMNMNNVEEQREIVHHPEHTTEERKEEAESESFEKEGFTNDGTEEHTSLKEASEEGKITLPTEQTSSSVSEIFEHDVDSNSNKYNMSTTETSKDSDEGKSHSRDRKENMNENINFIKVKYACAFILMCVSVAIGNFIANKKDDESDDTDIEGNNEILEFRKSFKPENKEEIIDISFSDYNH